MTDQPTPETDDFRPCHLTPSDWPAFARALEIERNTARVERDELNRQLSVALKGKRPYSTEFADQTIAAQVKRIAELEEKLNGWFSERNAVRAERDDAFSLGRHAMFCVHHTDAQREANTVGGNCPICNKAQIRQLCDERDAKQSQLKEVNSWLDECVKQRDTANALSLSLCADRAGDAKDRDDEIAVLRADVARLREILQRIVSNGGSATNVMLFDARTALAQ